MRVSVQDSLTNVLIGLATYSCTVSVIPGKNGHFAKTYILSSHKTMIF